ncbi:hypothetical protein Droror1_Dr00025470 [Drosera rotundifolia]
MPLRRTQSTRHNESSTQGADQDPRRRNVFGARCLASMMRGMRRTMREWVDTVRNEVRDEVRAVIRQPQQQQPYPQTAENTKMHNMREFQRLRPPTFCGDTDPLQEEERLEQITQMFDTLGIDDDEQRVFLAVF